MYPLNTICCVSESLIYLDAIYFSPATLCLGHQTSSSCIHFHKVIGEMMRVVLKFSDHIFGSVHSDFAECKLNIFPVDVTQNRRKVLTNSILKCRERRLMLQGAKARFFEQLFRIPQIQGAPLFFKLVKSSLHELFLCPGWKGRLFSHRSIPSCPAPKSYTCTLVAREQLCPRAFSHPPVLMKRHQQPMACCPVTESAI